MNFEIDDEFANYMPGVSSECDAALEEEIKAEGRAREPLVVWKEEKFLKDEHRYGSPSLSTAIEQAVDSQLIKVIEQYVANEWREKIKEHVAAKLTDEVVVDFVNRAWEKMRYK